MNSKIKILDESTINLIAAGEVIDRPASIVKELIENSLDAGSKNIVVEILGSGQQYVKVSDDGYGMTKDDLLLAVERHATSKIDNSSDLFNIKTYGFRGEALPSIAGISKLNISTKQSNENITGVNIIIEGGNIIGIEEKGVPNGTTITVKDVFYNLPVRKKYVKKEITEFSHIYNVVEKYIIARPDVKFKLVHNESEIISSLGNGRLYDALILLYGVILKDKLIELEKESNSISVKGYIGNPQISYLNRTKESVFVNGRHVYAPVITRAIEEGYKNIIPNGRYPFAVVFIDIDPRKIDVNVHPAKKEIRFEKINEVLSIVKNAIKNAMEESGIEIANDSYVDSSQKDIASFKDGDFVEKLWTSDELKSDFEFMSLNNTEMINYENEPCFQYKDTYLVTIIEDQLVVIDQHTAHERILYERLSESDVEKVHCQELLLPLNITVSPIEKKIVLDLKEELGKLGYLIEEFGNNEFIIRSVPAEIYEKDHANILKDLIEEFKEDKSMKNYESIREKILITISCKSAVKAGYSLKYGEMIKLIIDLKNTKNPYTCPHGRPIIYKITEDTLQKIFKRR